MYTLKTRRVGNSLGVILPKDALQKLRVKKKDKVIVAQTHLDTQTVCKPDFEKAMESYKKVSTKYKNALRKLAQ
jgi:putative addiction module antidote